MTQKEADQEIINQANTDLNNHDEVNILMKEIGTRIDRFCELTGAKGQAVKKRWRKIKKNAPVVVTCKWTKSESDERLIGETWNTECKNTFQFTEEAIKENGFKFCPYCGNPIEEVQDNAD